MAHKVTVKHTLDCSGTGPLKINGPSNVVPEKKPDGSTTLSVSLELAKEILYNANTGN